MRVSDDGHIKWMKHKDKWPKLRDRGFIRTNFIPSVYGLTDLYLTEKGFNKAKESKMRRKAYQTFDYLWFEDEEFGDDFSAAGLMLAELGGDLDDFSIYWGDEEGNFVRYLNDVEKDQLEDYANMYKQEWKDKKSAYEMFDYSKAPKTPWGPADYVKEILRGVRWVGTPGHGGLMISEGVARKNLSPLARSMGDKYGGYICYEEDVAWAIPVYEWPEMGVILNEKTKTQGQPSSIEGVKENAGRIIEQYWPEYFEKMESGGMEEKPKLVPGMVLELLHDQPMTKGLNLRKGEKFKVKEIRGKYIVLDDFGGMLRVRLPKDWYYYSDEHFKVDKGKNASKRFISGFFYRLATSEQKLNFLRDKYDLSNESIDYIQEADPTKKGIYLDWIARQLKRKILRFPEDVEKLKSALGLFDKFKMKGFFQDQKDINKYSSPASLYGVIKKYQEVENVPSEQLKRERVEGAKAIIREGNYTWYEVTTSEAACSLGSGTSWCTVQGRWAESYLRDGPLYILYIGGKPKLQVHFPTGSFMDMDDRSVFYGKVRNDEIFVYDEIISEYSDEVIELVDYLDISIHDIYELEQEIIEDNYDSNAADLASEIEDRLNSVDLIVNFESSEEVALMYLIQNYKSNYFMNLFSYLQEKSNSEYEVNIEEDSVWIDTKEMAASLEISDLSEIFPNIKEEGFKESLLKNVELDMKLREDNLTEFIELLEELYIDGDIKVDTEFEEKEMSFILNNPLSIPAKNLYNVLKGEPKDFRVDDLSKVFPKDKRQLDLL